MSSFVFRFVFSLVCNVYVTFSGCPQNLGVSFFISCSRTIIHPEYNRFTKNNDLCLMKLSRDVDSVTHPHIRPACMPTEQPPDGTEVGTGGGMFDECIFLKLLTHL